MPQRKSIASLVAFLGVAMLAPAFAETPKPRIKLPLEEYVSLADQAEAKARAAEERERTRQKPLAEVVKEHIALRLDEKEAVAHSVFEVLVAGEPIGPIWLPLAGYGATARLQKQDARGAWAPAPAASLTASPGGKGGTLFLTTEAGLYRIEAESRLPAEAVGGKIELRLLEVAAPVASADLDLAAELEWSSPGAVLVEEKVNAGRRHLRLATQRGKVPLVRLQRRFEQGEEKTLAQAAVLTLLQLRPEGLRRHDVVFYEVSRGQISAFEVKLPPRLEVEQVVTDEGAVVPIAEGDTLRIERQHQLQGTGYLVLSSTPTMANELPWSPVEPNVEVRARYLAFASSLAAEVAPSPAASFSQIDLSDLPPLLGQALGAIRLAAAWRWQEGTAAASLRIATLPPAESLDTTVLERESTTLLTVDGTLLHRESFKLAPAERPASYFALTLPPGARLWSTKVDDQPVRPLQRDGKLLLPILAQPGTSAHVEVVAVLEQAIAKGRSQLDIELATVTAPVLEHNWRLLLPDGPKYRYAGGDLLPVPADAVTYRPSYSAAPQPPRRPAAPKPQATGRRARGDASIEGAVSGDGGPLPGAMVTLSGPVGTLMEVTAADGSFHFESLPAGRYTVSAQLEGFGASGGELTLENTRRWVYFKMEAAIEETITVTSEAPLLDERHMTSGLMVSGGKSRRDKDTDEEREALAAAESYRAQIGDLKQGLVGGVKPLPIAIPETGKALLLSAILPPERVGVKIDVKVKK